MRIITFRLVFTLLVIFSILWLPCGSSITSITYQENDKVHYLTPIGTYSDGTMLYQVLFEGKLDGNIHLRLFYPNGTFGLMEFTDDFKNQYDPENQGGAMVSLD